MDRRALVLASLCSWNGIIDILDFFPSLSLSSLERGSLSLMNSPLLFPRYIYSIRIEIKKETNDLKTLNKYLRRTFPRYIPLDRVLNEFLNFHNYRWKMYYLRFTYHFLLPEEIVEN